MNKHTRLAVGILVLVLVLLIVATVSFSINISKKSAGSQNSTFDTGTNSNGNVIVEGDDHLYGVSDAAGNLILEPEWKELHFIGSDYLSAVQENADSNCVGVLDLDGNVVAPFVYDHVEALTDSYYLAVLAENQQVVLYDHDFRAADAMVWDSSTWEKPLLTVTSGIRFSSLWKKISSSWCSVTLHGKRKRFRFLSMLKKYMPGCCCRKNGAAVPIRQRRFWIW